MSNRTKVVFKVKACQYAYVLLGAEVGIVTHRAYEVCLGFAYNTQTYIRHEIGQSSKEVVNTTGGLLSNQKKTAKKLNIIQGQY